MLLVGVLIAVQSEVNGRLAEELGNGLRAPVAGAILTFGLGSLVMAVFVAAVPAQRRRLRGLARAARSGTVPLWLLSGGALGAFFVVSQGLAVGVIGLALFTMAVVLGQTTSGTFVDRAGLGPGGVQPMSVPRVLAAATALVAVVLATGGGGVRGGMSALALVLLLVSVLSGAGTAVQQALNGRIGVVAGPYVTAWLNTATGLVVLVVLFLVSLLLPGELLGWPAHWWLYTGGLLGVSFIALSAALVRVHGVLVLMLCTIAGQTVAAWLINVLDPSAAVPWSTHVATGLVIAGVCLALLTRRRHPGAA
jgi:transporter family-2 protein